MEQPGMHCIKIKKIFLTLVFVCFNLFIINFFSAASYGSGPYGAGAYGIGYTAPITITPSGGGGGTTVVYLYKGWEVIFEFENVNYTISLEDIVNKIAIIKVFGGDKFWNFNLTSNQTQKIDLNEDENYDLQISLGDIIGNKVYITANSIQESIHPPEATQEKRAPEKISKGQLAFIIILLIICLMISIDIIFLLKVKQKRLEKSVNLKPKHF